MARKKVQLDDGAAAVWHGPVQASPRPVFGVLFFFIPKLIQLGRLRPNSVVVLDIVMAAVTLVAPAKSNL